MSIIKFQGKIIKRQIETLPNGLKVMKVLFKEELDTSSPIFENKIPNYYQVMVYGKSTILDYWTGHNPDLPPPVCEVRANLTGRIKVSVTGTEYNNLTLIHKSIKFIYEQRN